MIKIADDSVSNGLVITTKEDGSRVKIIGKHSYKSKDWILLYEYETEYAGHRVSTSIPDFIRYVKVVCNKSKPTIWQTGWIIDGSSVDKLPMGMTIEG